MSYIAEQNIIGSILLRNECLQEIEFIRPEMFESEVYGKMFYICKNLVSKGQIADIPTLADKVADETYPYDFAKRDIAKNRIIFKCKTVFQNSTHSL